MLERVTGTWPLLVRCTGWVVEAPTRTVPKSRDWGETTREEGKGEAEEGEEVEGDAGVGGDLGRTGADAGGGGSEGEGEGAGGGGDDGGWAVVGEGEVRRGAEGAEVEGDGAGVGEGDGLGGETLPTPVLGKVRELWERV